MSRELASGGAEEPVEACEIETGVLHVRTADYFAWTFFAWNLHRHHRFFESKSKSGKRENHG